MEGMDPFDLRMATSQQAAQTTVDPVDKKDEDGRTALHRAAASGNSEMVRSLLGREATVDVQDGAGWTPLHIAGEIYATHMTALLVFA